MSIATLPAHFAAAMVGLGPWEPAPALGIAVSGGADSTALALLARDWAQDRGGSVLALIVDHGLRPESASEAELTRSRLAGRGIDAVVLTLRDLHPGPAMAERARIARYWVLADACNQYDRPHLLLGHHALDQAETVMIRVLGGSASSGLAGMAALAETGGARLLRPLLGVTPAALRHFLTRQRMEWVEDPSNASLLARRSRLRRIHADSGGIGAGTHAILAAVANAGRMRAESDRRVARILAERVTIRPEGFAIVSPGTIDPDVLSALIRTIGGLAYPPPATAVAALSRDLRPATLAGIRVQAAGRLGTGWLLTREVRAIGEPVEGRFGAVWDGRFRLLTSLPPGFTLGALAQDAVRLRRQSPLPASVLHTLPALRYGNMLAAVPHLDYRDPAFDLNAAVVFDPPVAMAGAPFVPASAANTTCRGCETGGDTLC